MKRVNILYTGGLDSSYTMMYFSKFPVEIQPYYLKDHRKSEEYELRAIHSIIEDIKNNPGTKATVNDLITKPVYEIKPDPVIQKAYRYMFKTVGFGKQYGFIARFAKQEKIDGLFISLVFNKDTKPNMIVRNSPGLEFINDEGMEYHKLNREGTEEHLYTLFEHVLFPPSFMHSKEQEIEEMKKLGFEDSIKKTWFCFWPVDGKPCGTCPPCRDLMHIGMTWRLPEEAIKRYEEDQKVPAWKHKLRDYKLTIGDKWYDFKMRHGF